MWVNIVAGVVVGLLSSGLLVVLHALDVLETPLGSQLLFLALAFHITGLIAALGYHRHRAARGGGGGASFAQLFGAGLMVSLVAGLVLAAGTHLFVTVVDPEYLDRLKVGSLERLAELSSSEKAGEELNGASSGEGSEASSTGSPMTEAELAQHRQQIEELTPIAYALQTLTSTLVAGFFLSLTLAAFLRMRVIRAARS